MDTLVCEGLSKTYGNVKALDHVDLHMEEGKIIGLLGPNGSGKTTLIKLASRLLVPTEGKITICGIEPSPETKAMVSYLPDRSFLPDWMNSRDLLDMYEDFFVDFDRARALTMLESLDIDMKMSLKKMSKGTKEKVQLILVMRAKESVVAVQLRQHAEVRPVLLAVAAVLFLANRVSEKFVGFLYFKMGSSSQITFHNDILLYLLTRPT